jgi:Xaa-Pro dipeptidase
MDLHLNNILNDMQKDGFQAYLLTQFTNVEYISGYRPTSFAFCIIKDDPIIYASGMDMELAMRDSRIEVRQHESFEVMVGQLKKEGIRSLAIEPSLPFSTYVKFRDDFKIDSRTYIDKQRMIKTPDEIERISEATKIAQKSFLQLDILNNENTEKGIAFDLARYMVENGALKESFDTIVASGANSSLPHAIPQDKKLDQPILVDWGAVFEGYCSDNTRTMVYTERQQEIWDIVAEAHDAAIKAIKPGIKCSDVDRVARNIISEYGYGDKFIHSTGHSLGLDIHETPGFSARDDTVVEEGMVITVEPGIYLEGEFGVRLEDTVSISKRASVIGNLPLDID